MYKGFFQLKHTPFGASPDPQFLYMMPHTREAYAGLEYGISARKGILVLTGEVGTGKTTLLRAALQKFQGERVHFAYVFNPRFEVLDFLEFVLTDFGLVPEARTKSGMLLQLNRWLIDCYRRHETCVIIVDEAQNCSWELMEEIRLLTNLETATEKLVQIVLAGQPELETRLRQLNARQLRQRVALWCRTYPLSAEETKHYIWDRLMTAGTSAAIFSDGAVSRIYEISRGIPRVINLICEHALILAYVNEEHTVSSSIVAAVSQDLVLDLETDGPMVSIADRPEQGSRGGPSAGAPAPETPAHHAAAIEKTAIETCAVEKRLGQYDR